MALEAATFISQLVATNPTGADQKAQGDDQMRLLKSVLQQTFPNADHAITFGGFEAKANGYVLKAVDYNQLVTDNGKVVYFDLSGAARTYNLLAVATATVGFLTFIDRDATQANDLTIDASGAELINSVASLVLKRGESGFLYCTAAVGNEWRFFYTRSVREFYQALSVIVAIAGDAAAFESTVAGAARGPDVAAYRNINGAVNNIIGSFVLRGKNTLGTVKDWARLRAKLLNVTAATEASQGILSALVANVETDIITFGPGVQIGTPTQGDKGPGTLNADNPIYVDGVNIGAFSTQLLHIRDEKASGTDGGTPVAATWTKHTLDDVKVNEIAGASQAASVITLPIGDYYIEAWSTGFRSNGSKIRLRNTTDATTAVVGGSAFDNNGGAFAQSYPPLEGRFTVSGAPKNFELQYWIGTAIATVGLGNAVTTGEVEVYADARIWKL